MTGDAYFLRYLEILSAAALAHRMKFLPFFSLALFPASLVAQEPKPAEVFQINCSACHFVDQMVVGPSLVEIAGLYKNKPEDFVKWCIAPQHKREGAIEMPSMAHLGEDTLRSLHGYILKAAEGKTELKPADKPQLDEPGKSRPQVQRMFLPDASPAAIAVAMPGSLSYCFDASECRLRYVWKGGFIDAKKYWETNGSSLAKIDGDVIYREESRPIGSSNLGKPTLEFLGYRIEKDGLPTFLYRIDGTTVSETVRPLPDDAGISREFTLRSGSAFTVPSTSDAQLTSSTGSLRINPAATPTFTLTYRWK